MTDTRVRGPIENRTKIIKRRAAYLLAVGVVVANAAAVALWKFKTERRAILPEEGLGRTRYGWGDPAPPFKLLTITGQVIDSDTLRGKTVLLEFYDPADEEDWERVFYADMLARRYVNDGLRVVAISEGAMPGSSELISGIAAWVVADDNGSIADLFGVRFCCGGTILIDRLGVMRFLTPYHAPLDVIRAVVERQLGRGGADVGNAVREEP